jgi:hypothetical protein
VNTDHRERIAELSRAPLAPLRSRWDKILKTCLQVDPRARPRANRGWPALATEAKRLRQDAMREIDRLQKSAQPLFRCNPWVGRPRPRIASRPVLTPKGGRLTLRAVLLDLHSGAPVMEWSANYAPDQLRWSELSS